MWACSQLPPARLPMSVLAKRQPERRGWMMTPRTRVVTETAKATLAQMAAALRLEQELERELDRELELNQRVTLVLGGLAVCQREWRVTEQAQWWTWRL